MTVSVFETQIKSKACETKANPQFYKYLHFMQYTFLVNSFYCYFSSECLVRDLLLLLYCAFKKICISFIVFSSGFPRWTCLFFTTISGVFSTHGHILKYPNFNAYFGCIWIGTSLHVAIINTYVQNYKKTDGQRTAIKIKRCLEQTLVAHHF